MKTIEQVQAQLEQRVSDALTDLGLLPKGFKHSVRFHGKARDKKKTADFEKNWSPETDSIHIRFEPVQELSEQPARTATPPTPTSPSSPPTPGSSADPNPLSGLIRALDRAESRRGYDFVSLKWFRDTALVSEGYPWASSDAMRQNVLRIAIENRLVLTSKVANPKAPQFPVTAIRLNRLMPEVKKILGDENEGGGFDFHPVEIRGESLSATILRERR